MAVVFSLSNQKGGVGKTTTSVNLATVCSNNNIKTLLIDLDPQGNATSGFGIQKNDVENTVYEAISGSVEFDKCIIPTDIPNLFIAPANSNLAAAELELIDRERREYVVSHLISSIKNDYDYIIIDCPPSLGLLTINALAASQYLVIPLQCEYYALEGLSQLLNTFNLVKNNLNTTIEIGGVILTMADFRTNLTQQVIEEVKKYFSDKVFETIIPRSVKISEAPSFGKPIVLYDPSSKGAAAYENVGREFIKRFKDSLIRTAQTGKEERHESNSEMAEDKNTETVEQTDATNA